MEKLQPMLRFPEFKGAWNSFRLEEIAEVKTGPFGSSLHQEDYVSKGTPIITVEHLSDLGIIHKNLPLVSDIDKIRLKSYHLKSGDLVFSRVGSVDRCSYISALEDGWLFSGRLLRVRLYNQNSQFYNFLFQLEKTKQKVRSLAVGQTMPSINTEILKSIEIENTSLSEQTKIASFLSAVDQKLNLLKVKKAALEEYKKGMMQKIFSQELRFKDKNGKKFAEWVEKKLGDFAKITTGSSNREDSNLDGEYTFFDRSQDIRSSNRYLFDEEAVIVPGEGKEFIPKYFKGKFDLHQRTYAIMQFGTNNGFFLFYSISFNRRHLDSHAVGSTVKSLRLPMFESMPISLPCLEEQTKIASFLSSIDEKIELVTQQIEDTQEYKKGLLQQLFC